MKIDKTKVFSAILGTTLLTGLISGCSSEPTQNFESQKDMTTTGVVLNGDIAIIVKEDDLYTDIYDSTGYHTVIDNFKDSAILFHSDEDNTSYEKAFKFAQAIVGKDGKVYDYDYLMVEQVDFNEINNVKKIVC